MPLKEIRKDIYDVDAWIDEGLGAVGTPQREKAMEEAWEEYNAQILLDARKNARLTQQELAERIGADKGYIVFIPIVQMACCHQNIILIHRKEAFKAAQMCTGGIDSQFLQIIGQNIQHHICTLPN